MYNKTIDKCTKLEKDLLLLEQEKKSLCEKTLKYDQLLDQKRRIEDIVNQMKNTEVLIVLLIYNICKLVIKLLKTFIVS